MGRGLGFWYFLAITACTVFTPGRTSAQTAESKLLLPFDKGIIRDIQRDSLGLLWVATHNGLLRYDGHRTKVYEPGQKGCGALGVSYFLCIQPLPSSRGSKGRGDLLLGTNGQGLLYYSALHDSLMQVEVAFDDSAALARGNVRKMLHIGDNKVLLSVGFQGPKLIEYDYANQSARTIWSPDNALPPTAVLKRDPLDSNLIWFSDTKLKTIHIKTGKVKEYPGPFDVENEGFAQALAFCGSDTLMVGTLNALITFDRATDSWSKNPGEFIGLDMAEMPTGDILVGNTPLQNFRNGCLDTLLENGTPVTRIFAEGNYAWVAVINKGIYLVDLSPSQVPMRRIVASASLRNAARIITKARKRGAETWYSALGSLPLWVEAGDSITGIPSPPGTALDAADFAWLGTDALLLATNQGLWTYQISDSSFQKQELPEEKLGHVLSLGPQEAIVCGAMHAYHWSHGVVRELKSNAAQWIKAEMVDGSTYVLAAAGLHKLVGDSLVLLDAPFSIAHSMTVMDGALWVSADYSLYRYQNAVWQHLPYADQSRVMVNALNPDNRGRLWGLTAEGLAYFNIADRVINLIEKKDGLLYTDVSNIRLFPAPDAADVLHIGYAAMLGTLNTDAIGIEAAKPPVFTSIRAMDLPYAGPSMPQGNDTLHIHHTENYLRLAFAKPYFNHPARQTFTYKLEGYEDIWHFTQEVPEAYYTGLPPGNYKFMVRPAYAKEGEATLEKWIFIEPPFWKTGWFQGLMIMLIAGLVLLLYFTKVRRIRRQEAQRRKHLMELNELEMKAIRAQMNPHFIFNCLNSIRACIMEGKAEDAIDYIGKFGKLMRLVLDLSRGQKTTLRDEIEMLKLYIGLEELRMNRKINTRISLDPQLNTDRVKIPGMLIQPLVENALWHGFNQLDREPVLELAFAKNGQGALEVRIEDNGHGRKVEQNRDHISQATKMIKERLNAENLAGKPASMDIFDLKDPSGKGAGTRITLRFTP